jgi:glucokinase
VLVENDANAAAVGEHSFGAGRHARHVIYLTISTGIGGGIIIDGRLYRGASGAAGEFGHVVLVADGPRCSCGGSGHLEALASGTAIAREGAALVAQGRAPLLARIAAGQEMTAEHVAEAAEQGDLDAGAVIATAGRYLGLGLASFVNLLNPEVIVIGGGAAKIGAPLLGPAEAVMRASAFPQPVRDVTVRPSLLGDEAVVRGAIALAQQAVPA